MVYGAPPGHGGVQPAFDAGPPSTIQLTNPMARAGHARGWGYANDPRSQQILSALTGNTYTRSRDDVGSKASVHTTDGPGVTAVCKQARPSTIAYRGGTQAAGGHPRANPPFTHTHAFATRCQNGRVCRCSRDETQHPSVHVVCVMSARVYRAPSRKNCCTCAPTPRTPAIH